MIFNISIGIYYQKGNFNLINQDIYFSDLKNIKIQAFDWILIKYISYQWSDGKIRASIQKWPLSPPSSNFSRKNYAISVI